MGVAADLARVQLLDEFEGIARIRAMRDRLESTLLRTIPETRVQGDPEHRLPNTTNIGFARVQSEAILLLLSEQGICASAGAACSSGSLEPSHVMQAMKVDPIYAHGAIRFSLGRYNTEREVDQCLEALPPIIEKLRRVMPV
jgi:cysteine desulfurase